MYVAASRGHADVVRLLLEAQADVNHRKSLDGMYLNSPLAAAAHRGHVEVARVLLKAGAGQGPDRVDELNDLLMSVCAIGHVELVPLLLEHGASANGSENPWTGMVTSTPLSLATKYGNAEVARLLVGAGAVQD